MENIIKGIRQYYPVSDSSLEVLFSHMEKLELPINPEKPDVPLNKNDAFQKVQKRRVQEKR